MATAESVLRRAYGCAALKWWGDPAFVTLIRERNKNDRGRGNRGRRGNGGRGGSNRGGGQATGSQPRAERATRRAIAKDQATNTADSQEADCADVVFALWTHSARKGQHQAEVMKADRTRDKVRT